MDKIQNQNIGQFNTSEQLLQEDELKLLSIDKARSILGIRSCTFKKLIDEGKIAVIKINKNFKISRRSLIKFIETESKPVEQKVNETKSNQPPKSVGLILKNILNQNK